MPRDDHQGTSAGLFDVFQGGEHSPKSVLYVSIMLKMKRDSRKESTMNKEEVPA